MTQTIGQQLDATLAAQQQQIAALQAAIAPSPFKLFSPMPDDVLFAGKIAKTYYVANAPEGDDVKGDGTIKKPFATGQRAHDQGYTDRGHGDSPAILPAAGPTEMIEISYKGGQKFQQDVSPKIVEDWIVFDSYDGIAEIDSSGIPFQRVPNSPTRPQGLYLQYLDIVHTGPTDVLTYGFMTNGVDHVGSGAE